MQGNIATYTFAFPGTMTANLLFKWKLPFGMQLVHASAVISNAGDTNVRFGISGDDDLYMTNKVVGASGTPETYDRANFVGTEYPHLLAGTTFLVTVDFDGAAGTAGADLTLVLTFMEG